MDTIPLDVMCWISLGALALGVLAMIPVWWSNHRGWYLTPTPEEVRMRAIAGTLTVGGAMGLFGSGVLAMQRSLSAGSFMLLGGLGMVAMLAFALTVDTRARRRH